MFKSLRRPLSTQPSPNAIATEVDFTDERVMRHQRPLSRLYPARHPAVEARSRQTTQRSMSLAQRQREPKDSSNNGGEGPPQSRMKKELGVRILDRRQDEDGITDLTVDGDEPLPTQPVEANARNVRQHESQLHASRHAAVQPNQAEQTTEERQTETQIPSRSSEGEPLNRSRTHQHVRYSSNVAHSPSDTPSSSPEPNALRFSAAENSTLQFPASWNRPRLTPPPTPSPPSQFDSTAWHPDQSQGNQQQPTYPSVDRVPQSSYMQSHFTAPEQSSATWRGPWFASHLSPQPHLPPVYPTTLNPSSLPRYESFRQPHLLIGQTNMTADPQQAILQPRPARPQAFQTRAYPYGPRDEVPARPRSDINQLVLIGQSTIRLSRRQLLEKRNKITNHRELLDFAFAPFFAGPLIPGNLDDHVTEFFSAFTRYDSAIWKIDPSNLASKHDQYLFTPSASVRVLTPLEVYSSFRFFSCHFDMTLIMPITDHQHGVTRLYSKWHAWAAPGNAGKLAAYGYADDRLTVNEDGHVVIYDRTFIIMKVYDRELMKPVSFSEAGRRDSISASLNAAEPQKSPPGSWVASTDIAGIDQMSAMPNSVALAVFYAFWTATVLISILGLQTTFLIGLALSGPIALVWRQGTRSRTSRTNVASDVDPDAE